MVFIDFKANSKHLVRFVFINSVIYVCSGARIIIHKLLSRIILNEFVSKLAFLTTLKASK